MGIESPSAAFLQTQLEMLGRLLAEHAALLSASALDVALEWTFGVVNSLGADVALLSGVPELEHLKWGLAKVLVAGRLSFWACPCSCQPLHRLHYLHDLTFSALDPVY